MKFLKYLQPIDYALIVSFLPVFFLLPIFMKIFVFIGIIGIIKKVNYKILFVIGILAFLISFYNAFNFYGISKFATYILMLASLLTIAVILQRVENINNFYLKISPAFFFLLDILAYQNIFMLFYSVFVLFVFILILVYERIKDYKESFIFSLKLMLISFPVVVILFIFFPRSYIKKSSLSFKSDAVVSGFDDKLVISKNSVISNNAIVMEVKFNKMPKEFYFRGEVLYKNLGNLWIKDYKSVNRDYLAECKGVVSYTLKEYPTLKKNVFAYDIPFEVPNGYILTKLFTVYSKKKIKTPINIKLSSCKEYKLITKITKTALEFNKNYNKKAFNEVKKFLKIKDDEKRLNALISYFSSKNLTYTLNPPAMNGTNIVDELFKYKKGYCIHFASAFATLARMINLPSRIITGFIANEKYKNYVVIHSKDAHAWVEVYLKKRGWVRVDPTRFIYKVENRQKANQNINIQTFNIKENKSLWLMYLRFNIEEWILYYNFFKQQQLFKKLKNKEFLAKFISSILGLIILVFLILHLAKKRDIYFYENLLLKKLEKRGFKKGNETLYSFLTRVNLIEIRDLIYKIKFADKKELLKVLKQKIRKI